MILELENIELIEHKKAAGSYKVKFKDKDTFRVSNGKLFIPLLLLIKHESINADALDSDVINELIDNLPKGPYMKSLNLDLDEVKSGFKELSNDKRYDYIESRKINGDKVYFLPKSCHRFLSEKMSKMSELEMAGYDEYRVIEIQGNKCNICKMVLKEGEYQADFRIPRLRGGQIAKENIQIICKACYTNKKKICFGCISSCGDNCKLAFPEKSNIIEGLSK